MDALADHHTALEKEERRNRMPFVRGTTKEQATGNIFTVMTGKDQNQHYEHHEQGGWNWETFEVL